jgi:hypothetical protein
VVDVVATDARALAWRHTLRAPVTSLAWSADGTLLAAASQRAVTLLDGAGGRVRRRITAPRGLEVAGIAFAHRSRELAVTLNSADGRAQALAIDVRQAGSKPRRLFAGSGHFGGVRWSPDDRWVLISWPAANQWLFLRSARVCGVSAVRDIARLCDPGVRSARFPAIADWCCG